MENNNPIRDNSLQSRISSIGNQIHNLGCDHQDNDGIMCQVEVIRGEAWKIAIDAGRMERELAELKMKYAGLMAFAIDAPSNPPKSTP